MSRQRERVASPASPGIQGHLSHPTRGVRLVASLEFLEHLQRYLVLGNPILIPTGYLQTESTFLQSEPWALPS
jgi:hypothetical protein